MLGVILKRPFCGDRWFCLPVLFRLYVPKKAARKKGLPYHTKPQLAVQMLQLPCGRFENRQFHAVGDSTYGGKSVLTEAPAQLRADQPVDDGRPAVRHAASEPQEPQEPQGRAAARKRGERLPTPEAMLAGRCAHLTLDIYGRKDKSRA